ncbi:lipoyl(octanoyl) transferase LipB [Sandaracinobacteroides saxicola]|uniref:Octanoyltransferase n=1 Tax=Sandaracinobacteroides saxicola TaxID=2759707 RepID=A0A7G5IG02_9SPHN|nr:lipoyl(octanoyl) transferase LipB [Sandaracinobacteroides saxicola]QMW22294.1 lipoyl(octanoyl) transferase LipB [Sandaracinobacteroides saxicola]
MTEHPTPAWRVEPGLLDYAAGVAAMEARAEAVARGEARELIWLVEHASVYTAGTSADPAEHVGRPDIPLVRTGRGGRHTWHGPGQRVVYPVLNLGARRRDVRGYVAALEGWAVGALARLGVAAFTIAGDTGIWVREGGTVAKIGAIGVRIRRWVAFHGMALNVSPDLAAYSGIVPCGIADRGVTSLAALGVAADMAALDAALAAGREAFLHSISDAGEMMYQDA